MPEITSIAFYETRFSNGVHATANAGMIGALLSAYPESDMHLFAERMHGQSVMTVLREEERTEHHRVHFHEMPRLNISYGIGKKIGILRSFLALAREKNCNLVIFADPIEGRNTQLVLGVMALYGWGLKSLITYHGALKRIVGEVGEQQAASPITAAMMITAAAFLPIHYVVFSPHIAERVKIDLPQLGRYFSGIDIPYHMRDVVLTPPTWAEGEPIRFGMIGGNAWESKGYDIFVALAQDVKQVDAEFYVVGSYVRYEGVNDDKIIHMDEGGGLVDFEVYTTMLKRMDYCVFTSWPENYVYSTSASFSDALRFSKPIIVLANPFFEYIFERFGDVGYLCQSVEDMKATVARIANEKPTRRFMAQAERMLEVRRAFSVDVVGARIKEITESL